MALTGPQWHLVFELLAYFLGGQLYWRLRRHDPVRADQFAQVGILVGLVLGAAIGSKLAYWLEHPGFAFANFPNLAHLVGGKSIVGGLLGGLIGVESAKRLVAVRQSTGDALVWPLAFGMAIGRIGCFVAGLTDATYGLPSTVPWAVDFGDGIPRHPTQLYEIAWLIVSAGLISVAGTRWRMAPGDRFKLFLSGYLLWRLLIDALKPIPEVYWPGLSGIQWLCVLGLLYYLPHLYRMRQTWATK